MLKKCLIALGSVVLLVVCLFVFTKNSGHAVERLSVDSLADEGGKDRSGSDEEYVFLLKCEE